MDTKQVEDLLRYAADSGQLDVDLTDADIDVVLKGVPDVELPSEARNSLPAVLRIEKRRYTRPHR